MVYDRNAHGNGVPDQHRKFKLVALLLLAIITLTISTTSALALSLDIDSPEYIREGEILSVSFSEIPSSGNVNYTIYRDNLVIANNSNHDWSTQPGDQGTYVYGFQANTSSEGIYEEKTIEVLPQDLDIEIVSPIEGVISDEELRITVLTGNEAQSCSYNIDGSITGQLNEGNDDWYKIILLGTDKIYNLTVECSMGNGSRKESTIFILDTKAPSIISKSPQGSFSGTPIPLEIETDENSICRYSEEDESYLEMQKTFSQTGGTEHKQMIGIEEQEDLTYHVACRDRHGNIMTINEKIQFFANLKPSAKIYIDGDEGHENLLKPGTYEVTVKPSEEILDPILQYEFSKERVKKSITLQRSGDAWEGFLAIPEDLENDVGTFFFSANDMTEQTGTEIKEGKIFLVDTLAPDQIESFKASVEGIDAKLEWFYEGEMVKQYNIYRGTSSGIDHLDKYDDTSLKYYTDEGVLLGKEYFYRVAAVDKAGNVGPLSKEVKILMDVDKAETDLNPIVSRKLNTTKEHLREYLFNIEGSIKRLEGETDRLKNEVISKLGLLGKARQAQSSISVMMNEIDKLMILGLEENEADRRIETYLENAGNKMQEVPTDIEIVDNVRHDQALLESDIEQAVNEILIGLDMDKEQKAKYTDKMKVLQDSASVSLEAISARIFHMDQVIPHEITLMNKKVITGEVIDNAIIVENIPKEVARRASDITFQETPKILQPDPIVKWETTSLSSKDLHYRVNSIIDMNDAKNTKTVILSKPNIAKGENEITGAVTEEKTSNEESGMFSQILLFIAMVVAGTLLIYYVAFVKEGEVKQTHTIIPGQQARQPERMKHPKRAVDIHRSINQGHTHANNVNYEEALQIYRKILEDIEKEKTLPKKYRKKLESNIQDLHNKLSILLHIKKAHHAVDTSDMDKLKDYMLNIKKMYGNLERESGLAEHTRKNYSYFMNHMRNMQRENFFKNLKL